MELRLSFTFTGKGRADKGKMGRNARKEVRKEKLQKDFYDGKVLHAFVHPV